MSIVYNSLFLLMSIIVFSFHQSVFAQSQMLILKSESGKTKKINLSKLGTVNITIPEENSAIDCGATTFSGEHVKVESGLMYIKLQSEVFQGKENGYTFKNEKKTRRHQEPEISLNLQHAVGINLTSRASENISTFGGILTLLGSFTTLIVAPLVSINYADGGFNSQRYFKVAGTGLGAAVVGIPLVALFRSKTYVLKDFSGNDKEIWSVVN